MNFVSENNLSVWDREVIINGRRVPSPPTDCRSITMINGKLFIDGYEFKNGVWKKTFRAWWHIWF